jgi:Fic family protein
MNAESFAKPFPGQLVQVTTLSGETGLAFVPAALPPEISIDREIALASERAALALGNLNGAGRLLPNPALIHRPFMQREALASSRIEGTQADFDQLVLFEASEQDDASEPDIQEVRNYLAALRTGWLKPPERQYTPGLLMELHKQLLHGVRGADLSPGQLRSSQVHIGAMGAPFSRARFVPPPPEFVRDLLENLCAYIEESDGLPLLTRVAIIHYQFETIHPFMDGNGRLGRILIPIMLHHWGHLDLPLLYVSEFFEENKQEYMDRLLAVSQQSDWKGWILFALDAIERQATDALLRSQQLLHLRESFRLRYQEQRSTNLLRIVDLLFERPALTISQAADQIGVTFRVASRIIDTLQGDGVLLESTGQRRNRVFYAPDIIAAMSSRAPIEP